MYKNISDCKSITRGDNRKSLIASCVFFACKKNGKTRTPQEIGDLFDLDYSDITKGCKKFNQLSNIAKINIAINVSTPEHFINRFCQDLKLKKNYIDEAILIAKNIKKLNIASVHTPTSIALGSILLVSEVYHLNLSRKNLAEQFNISEVTVIKAYKKIEKYKKALINNDLTDKIVNVMKQNINSIIPDHVKKRMESLKISNNDIKTTFPSYNKYDKYQNSLNIVKNKAENKQLVKISTNNDIKIKTFIDLYYDIVRNYHLLDKEIQRVNSKFMHFKNILKF
jgi:hypothetical protein